MVLASQTPPKTRPKSFQNRRSKKHGIFHRFLFDFCCLLQEPTSISYWFLQYKMALGRFSSCCFLHGFGIQKTIQKPIKNHARATQKSISKTCCFLISIFSHFGFDFGGSWASKLPQNGPQDGFETNTVRKNIFQQSLKNQLKWFGMKLKL